MSFPVPFAPYPTRLPYSRSKTTDPFTFTAQELSAVCERTSDEIMLPSKRLRQTDTSRTVGFARGPVHVDFTVDKVTMWHAFLQEFQFCPVSIISTLHHTPPPLYLSLTLYYRSNWQRHSISTSKGPYSSPVCCRRHSVSHFTVSVSSWQTVTSLTKL